MKDSKDIEKYLYQLLIGNTVDSLPKDKYGGSAITMFNYIKPLIGNNYNSQYKPGIKTKATYSKKSGEPKTDIIIRTPDIFKLTIKEDDGAYIVSCNSPEDFITQFIDIHDGKLILDKETIENLEKCSKYIKKVPNFYSYDKTYKKNDNVEGFVEDKFCQKALKYSKSENVTKYAKYIIECYKNKNKQAEYISYLHEAESFLQKTIKNLFEKYPDYSKKIIFEFLTGNIKFNSSDSSSDYLISNYGIYKLDNNNCEYVNSIYNKFINSLKIGRLQNVPRKSITKKILSTNDLKLIAESFSVADLTFKI